MDISTGMLARRTGVKAPTMRCHEQIGLMPGPPRTQGRQRRYGPQEVSRLNFISHSRELVFDIGSIRELLAISERPEQSCAAANSIAQRRLGEVDRRIAQPVELRAELRRMVEEYGQGEICNCRVIEALAKHGANLEVLYVRRANLKTARRRGDAPSPGVMTAIERGAP